MFLSIEKTEKEFVNGCKFDVNTGAMKLNINKEYKLEWIIVCLIDTVCVEYVFHLSCHMFLDNLLDKGSF